MPDPRFFTRSRDYTVAEIAELTGAQFEGDGARVISGVAPLETAGSGDLSFLQNRKYAVEFTKTRAGACFVEPGLASTAPDSTICLTHPEPYKVYGKFARVLFPDRTPAEAAFRQRIAASAKIDPTAVVSETAVIGENVEIGPECFIGPQAVIDHGVKIGEKTEIGANASIAYAYIGSRVLIHPGVRIGQRGFGFAPDADKPVKIPQLGRVIIEDDVEIGANSTIDRGTGPDTVIGRGTMIDNLVQIAHNVKIGRNCIIVSQVGISGSTELGDFVVVGGQAGLTGHLKIGNFVQIASKSGVMKDLPEKAIVGGIPSVPIKDWHRQTVSLKNLAKKGPKL